MRSIRGAVTVSLLALVFLSPAPARADPAGPTNYESEVLELEPPSGAVSVRVVGGDSFLEVAVMPGHELIVPGYGGEPYLRVDGGGTVWVNVDSPAHYLNDDRFGAAAVPDDADGRGDPRWQRVGEGGRYAWHDHRIHWMSRNRPPTLIGDVPEVVFPWKLPVLIDGVKTEIKGELSWLPSLNPVVPLVAGIVALVPVMTRRHRSAIVAVLVVIAACLAVVITVSHALGTPAAARTVPAMIVLPLIALVAGIWVLTGRTSGAVSAMVLTLTAGLALGGWALASAEVLWLPILASPLPAQLERIGTSFVFWSGAAGVVASVTVRNPASATG